jgi:uncharacterized protein YgbK (DUF1537 family)
VTVGEAGAQAPASPASGLVRIAHARYVLAVASWVAAADDRAVTRAALASRHPRAVRDHAQASRAEREAAAHLERTFGRWAKLQAQAQAAGMIGA